MAGRRERYKGEERSARCRNSCRGGRTGSPGSVRPATTCDGSNRGIRENGGGSRGRATEAGGRDLRGVPAGDVETGEAGEEGHDERDPAGGASGGGRGRLLGAAVLTPHGAGKRLHGGGRGDLRAPARAGLCFPLLLLTALHFLPLKKTVKVSQKKWQRLKGDSQVS
jgi:hypothetical protein